MQVSVIIPTCNKYKHLNITLASLYAQEKIEGNFEVIVVDDGCSNYTDTVIKFWANLLNIRTYKTMDKKGRASARNLGAEKAKGEILVFLDDDVLAMPNLLREHLEFHNQSDENVVIGYRYRLDQKPSELFSLINSLSIVSSVKNIKYLSYLKDERESIYKKCNYDIENFSVPWVCLFSNNFSIRKKYFIENAGFDERFQKRWGVEDVEFGFRLYKKNVKFKLARQAKSYHLPHRVSWKNNLIDLDANLKIFYEKHPSPEIELYIDHLKIGILKYIECMESIKNGIRFSYDIENYEAIKNYLKSNISGKSFVSGIESLEMLKNLNIDTFCCVDMNIAKQIGKSYLKIFGTRTPYKDNYFDTVIIGCLSFIIIPQYFTFLIQEAYRISKKVLFVLDNECSVKLSKLFGLKLNNLTNYKKLFINMGLKEDEIIINKKDNIYFLKIVKKNNFENKNKINISFSIDLSRPTIKTISIIEMAKALSNQGVNIHINNVKKFISYKDLDKINKNEIGKMYYLNKQEKKEMINYFSNNVKLLKNNFYEIPISNLINETPKIIGWSENEFMGFRPDEEIRFINEELEMVWHFSEYAQKLFINNGGDINKSYVIPYGVNPELYKPFAKIKKRKKFIFIAITSVFEEHGIDIILDSFYKKFKSNKNVELIIYVEPIEEKYEKGFFQETVNYKNYLRYQNQVEMLFNSKLNYYKTKYFKIKNIHIKVADRNDKKKIFYYKNCDVYIHMHQKDFSGINILRAMSCAKPVIAINKFIPKGLCTNKNCFIIPSKIDLAEESENVFLAKPNISKLKELLKFVYQNKNIAMNKGLNARKDIINKWTWEHSAQKAIDTFKKRQESNKTNKFLSKSNKLYIDLIKSELINL